MGESILGEGQFVLQQLQQGILAYKGLNHRDGVGAGGRQAGKI